MKSGGKKLGAERECARRPHAMGKELSLFDNGFATGNYRDSVWITNSEEPAYDVWKQCRPRANDENTIKEMKEDFALGGFSSATFIVSQFVRS